MNYIAMPGLTEKKNSSIVGFNETMEQRADIIINLVCSYFLVKKEDLLGKRRFRRLSYPRQVACLVIYQTTSLSLNEIAKIIGGRNHTTIIHAKSHIQDLMDIDKQVVEDINQIKVKFKNMHDPMSVAHELGRR